MHIDDFKRPLLTALLAALGVLAVAVPATAANIVNNGGFESGDWTGWTGSVLSSPYSGVFCPGAGSVPENTCEAFVGTNGASATLSQVLGTAAGQAYAVSFSFKSDGSTPSSFAVSFANQTLYNVVSPALAAPQTFTFLASAVGTSTALVFNFRNDPGYFLLDAVSVNAVPEPESLALMAIGLAGLVAKRRWAQRKG